MAGWLDSLFAQSAGQGGILAGLPAWMADTGGPRTGWQNTGWQNDVGQLPAPVVPVTADSTVRSLATGIPILGGLANKGNAAINAFGAPYAPSIFGDLPEKTFGERYRHALSAEEEELDQSFHATHPALDTGLQITGGIASTLPVAATATGAKLLGLTGSLPGMMMRGATSNAAISAADALTRGGDVAASAGIGSIVGAGAPVVGRAVSAAATPVINTVRGILNPAQEAARRVGGAVARDVASGTGGLNPQEFAAAQQSGVPVNLMDRGGEATRDLARSAANTSPEARNILDRGTDSRFETQGNRLTDWFNSTFHYPDAAAQQAALEEAARSSNAVLYRRAMREGSDGMWSDQLARLAGSDSVAAAMRKADSVVRDEVARSGEPLLQAARFSSQTPELRLIRSKPDLRFWDMTRRELSDSARAARAAQRPEEAERLAGLADRLNAELDQLVPSYRAARQNADYFFGAKDALEAGQKFVTSEMANDEARRAIAGMSPIEKQLFQDGFVSSLIQKIREVPDRRSVVNQIGQSPAAQERLTMALGPQRARELQAMLHVEDILDLARPVAQGGATTARQLAELGLAGDAQAVGSGGNVRNPDPTSLMSAALIYGAARGRNFIDTRVAQQVARMLTSNDPKQHTMGMRMLTSNKRMFSAIRNTDAALAAIGARGAEPALSD